MTSFAHSIAATRIPSEPESNANEAQEFVGKSRASYFLTADEREHALELAELRQIHYEQEGQHVLASFMQTLIDDLVASRNQRGEQA